MTHTRIFALAIALLTIGCGAATPTDVAEAGTDTATADTVGDGDGDATLGCTPELESLQTEIFASNCAFASCHSSSDHAAGLDLASPDVAAQLIGAVSGTCEGWIRVVPGSPEDSLLYAKLVGPAPCGELMPPTAPLPAEQIACVHDWIEGLEGLDCEACGGDVCIDLESNAQHCGGCNNACPAGVACVAGACACPTGEQPCDGACVDVTADPDHCGECSTSCELGQVCSAGICSDGCGELSNCDGACVDLDSNPNHCGECNNACGPDISCEQGSCGCPGDGVSFATEVEPLLVADCTGMGCHGSPAPSAGLDLRAGFAYGDLVGVASSQCDDRVRVAPGQPGSSYLLDKLRGVDMCLGAQMPKAGPGLSVTQIATISEWICRGALDN